MNGYQSINADEIEMRIDSGFTLDGELFDTAGEPVRIRGGARAFFIGGRLR